ncbi:MAG TPA: 50S ribosomal protein L9 [Thermoanaerobaculaceae bacterium]|nr:50S ribosomal protein L9 [Thermoanaerobaculaceae bacterium]HRS15058.1 50S ribosomal protein L9 [Thermoanaerobaculaceae bacterium]
MKVILNDSVEHLGDRGTICEVKPGFARNFLIPKGLAYEATPANLARFKQEQRRWLEAQQRQKAQAELLAGKIAGLELSFYRRAGEGDALYGSVTVSDVAEALAEKGFEVDRRKIELGQHIKRLGTFSAELHLHRDVRVPITVHVLREGERASA